MAGDVKRYDIETDELFEWIALEEDAGLWVRYEDHAARLTALEQENKRLREYVTRTVGQVSRLGFGPDGRYAIEMSVANQIVLDGRAALTHEVKT